MTNEPGPSALASAEHPIESIYFTPAQAQALLSLMEAAPAVRRRSQFFMWMQGHVQNLVPHVLAVCGAYNRQRRQLEFDVFNTVAMPPALLGALSAPHPGLMSALALHWTEGDGRPFMLPVAGALPASFGASAQQDLADLQRAGVAYWVVHAVSRPGRRDEIETLFALAGTQGVPLGTVLPTLDLLLPHLHITYVRTQALERELTSRPGSPPVPTPEGRAPVVTARERQILHWVREGMSNQEIGTVLDISALTVKNHVQKILRKLGAANRAQAVAMALRSRLITANGAEFAVAPNQHALEEEA